MRLDDFLEKKERHQMAILQAILAQNTPLTRTELKDILGISKLSVDNYLNDLILELQPFQADCTLTLEDDRVSFDTHGTFDVKHIYHHFITHSLKFQLLTYALDHPHFSVLDVTHHLMISESTLFRKTKELNALTKDYNVKIKNGELVGEELQIRYLYFQVYWQISPYHELLGLATHNNQQKIIFALEKKLGVSLENFDRFRISLWMGISKKRLKVSPVRYDKMQQKMADLKQDPLYLEIKQLTLFFMSRYALEMTEEESMIHFIFITSMSILPKDCFTQYDLIRNRRSPITRADTWVRETIIFSYHPRKPNLELEKQMTYFISQINHRLYFFEGALLSPFVYPQKARNFTNRRKSATHLAEDLLNQVLAIFQHPLNNQTTLNQLAINDYEQLLALVNMKISHPIHIGINLWLTDLQKEVMTLELAAQFEQRHGVVVSPYEPTEKYDIILCNVDGTVDYHGHPKVFVATDWTLPYHIQKVHDQIQQLQYHA